MTTQLQLMMDMGGDGYFYDTSRTEEEGAFFWRFLESADYHFYPGLENIIAMFTECYRDGVFYVQPDGQLEEDYEASKILNDRFGVYTPPGGPP